MWEALSRWDQALTTPVAGRDQESTWDEERGAWRAELAPLLLDAQRQTDTFWLWDLTRRATHGVGQDAATVAYLRAGLTDRVLLGFSEPQWLRLVSVVGMLLQRAAGRTALRAVWGVLARLLRASYARGAAALLPWRGTGMQEEEGDGGVPPSLFGRQLPPSPAAILAAVRAEPWLFGEVAVQFHRQHASADPPWDRTLTSAVYESLVAVAARTLKQHKRYAEVPALFSASAVPHHRVAFAAMSCTLFHDPAELARYAHQVRALARDLATDGVAYHVQPANTAFLFDHFFASYLGVPTRRLYADLARCTELVYRPLVQFTAPHLVKKGNGNGNSIGRAPVPAWRQFLKGNGPRDDETLLPLAPLLGPGGAEGPGSLAEVRCHTQNTKTLLPPPRIGYLSAFFHDLHSVYRDRQGIIRAGRAAGWDVTLFAVADPPTQPCVQRLFRSADRVVVLAGNLAEAQAQVAAQELDVLVFCDLGMYPLSYYLAFARLARVQVNTWGHSDTSGIPNVDYFVSSRWFATESEDQDQDQFSERLVLLDSLTTYYQPLYDAAQQHLPRSGFRPLVRDAATGRHAPLGHPAGSGLPNDGPLLVCLQSLFKFGDEFLAVLVRILARCPTAYVVVLRDGDEAAESAEQALFESRLDRVAGAAAVLPRLLMLDRLPMVAYQSLLLYADLFLDPYPFGGCNSSFESFQHGQIVVTWPHPARLSGRFTLGLYRRMGLGYRDLDGNPAIVGSADAYVDAVASLLGDPDAADSLRASIRQNRHVLFAEQASVDEWYAAMRGMLAAVAPI
jgi:hypothetical protein